MILNKIIIIYSLLLFCSLALGFIGGAAGILSLARVRQTRTLEQRKTLENRAYLAMAAVLLGAGLRLVMLPLWFYMLEELVPVIPGAMCLKGVHQNVPFYSWAASAFKIILPLFYLSGILLYLIDRQLMTQPFMRIRHWLLMPLLLLLVTETWLDVQFLSGLQATAVPCCGQLSTPVSAGGILLTTESSWWPVGLFSLAFVFQTAIFRLPEKIPHRFLLAGICSLFLMVLLPLALHGKLSPLLLAIPFHTCIFCLLQTNPLSLLGFSLILIGGYLAFSFSMVGLAAWFTGSLEAVQPALRRLRTIALGLLPAGFAILAVKVLWQITVAAGKG